MKNIVCLNFLGKPVSIFREMDRGSLTASVYSFRASTAKRKLAKFLLIILCFIRMEWIFVKKCSKRKLGNHEPFIKKTILCYRKKFRYVFAVPPPQGIERGRIYLEAFNESGGVFIKLSLDKKNELMLKRELENMRLASSYSLPGVIIPKAEITYIGGNAALESERLPIQVEPLVLKHKINFIVYQRIVSSMFIYSLYADVDSVVERDFFKKFAKDYSETFPRLVGKVLSYKGRVLVGPAHGDLGPHNIFLDKKNVWMIDWEEFSHDAPSLSDVISLLISFYGSQINKMNSYDLVKEISCILNYNLGNDEISEVDVILGAIFVFQVNQGKALELMCMLDGA